MAQVIRKYIEPNAVGNDQMLLENEGYIRAVDAAGTGEVNMFKVNADDQISMAVSLSPAVEDLTLGSSISPFADTYSIGTFGKFVSLFEDMAGAQAVVLSSNEVVNGNPWTLFQVNNASTTNGLLIRSENRSEVGEATTLPIQIQTGVRTVDGASGDLNLFTGNGVTSSGMIYIKAGNASTGVSAGIAINAGYGVDNDSAGNISIVTKRMFMADGMFKLYSDAANPSALTSYEAGDMYYNSADNVIKYYDGAAWVALGDAAAAANLTLSNLEAPVALNQDLKPDTDLGRSIGAGDMRFASMYASELNGGIGNLNILADADSDKTIAVEAKSIKLEGDFTQVAGPNATAPGVMRFMDLDATNFIALAAPATVAADVTFTLPVADGSAGQVLTTDGAGQLEWASSQANDVWERETIILSAQNIIDGYVDLQEQAIDASLMLFADGLAQIFGASYDYTLSVVDGVTRVTFENTFATLVAENDVLVIQYQYAQ